MKKLTKLDLKGLAETMRIISVDEQRWYSAMSGYAYSNPQNPCPQSVFWQMLNNGTWGGGYVENMGYVIEPVTCTAYTSDGASHYSSLSDYLYSQQTSGVDTIAKQILGMIPGLSTFFSVSETYLNNQALELAGRIAASGFTSAFYVTHSVPASNSDIFKVTLSAYATGTGQLITQTDTDYRY